MCILHNTSYLMDVEMDQAIVMFAVLGSSWPLGPKTILGNEKI